MINRRLTITTLLLGLLSLSVFTVSASRPSAAVQVPQVTDLSKVGATANARKLPVLLVFSADHCPYCELLENEILKPMLISGDYQDRVLIYKIMLGEGNTITDFDGNSLRASELAQRYNVFVTPTMLFLDERGKELSERILGINTIEMFGGLVDAAIDLSLTRMRSASKQLASF